MANYDDVRYGYPIDQKTKQVYIHRLWRDYKKYYNQGKDKIDQIHEDTYRIYAEQSRRLRNAFNRNNNFDDKQGAKALETVEEVMNGIINGSTMFQDKSSMNIFTKDEYRVDGKSFYSYSSSAANREKLFNEEYEKLNLFIDKLDKAITDYKGISEEKRSLIESEVRKGGVIIPSSEWANTFSNIYEDGKADKGIKKLVAANMLLKKYAGKLSPEDAGNIPNIKDADAKEILRGISGSINNLAGGFFEIALSGILNQVGSEFMKDINSKYNIEIKGSELVGDNKIKIKALNHKKVTSKTDLLVSAKVKGLDVDFQFGLSLKTTTSNDGVSTKKKATKVHSGNLGNLIQRANALMSESTYHLANAAVHKNAHDALYRASRMKLAAILAFDALAGLGNKKDTAYFIIFQNRVINISDFLQQVADGRGVKGEPSVNMTIHGVTGYAAKARALKPGTNQVERYNRSREAMNIFLGLKVSLSI